jgi:hypothetical protein
LSLARPSLSRSIVGATVINRFNSYLFKFWTTPLYVDNLKLFIVFDNFKIKDLISSFLWAPS